MIIPRGSGFGGELGPRIVRASAATRRVVNSLTASQSFGMEAPLGYGSPSSTACFRSGFALARVAEVYGKGGRVFPAELNFPPQRPTRRRRAESLRVLDGGAPVLGRTRS